MAKFPDALDVTTRHFPLVGHVHRRHILGVDAREQFVGLGRQEETSPRVPDTAAQHQDNYEAAAYNPPYPLVAGFRSTLLEYK